VKDMMRVSGKNPCPICGHADWCGYNTSIAICMRVQSDIPAKHGGWVHKLTEDMNVNYIPPMKSDNSMASVDHRDKVYRLLLSKLTLVDRHKQHLLDRGVDEEFVRSGGYKTLPLQGRYGLTKAIIDMLGEDSLIGVPGFYEAEGNDGSLYWTLAGRPGLLIPMLNSERKIVCCQTRVDNPVDNVKKYQTLSTGNRPGGTNCGIQFHVAIPPEVEDLEEAWVTEGPLKGEIASRKLKRIFVCNTGVGNWQGISQVLKDLGVKRVVTAYDCGDDKPDVVKYVRHQLRNMTDYLLAAGFSVERAWWPLFRGKGIDDLLTAGFKPVKLSVA